MRIDAFLRTRPKYQVLIAGISLALLIGVFDYVTGRDLSSIVLYLAPVFLVSWYAGRDEGLVVSALSALLWFGADVLPRLQENPFSTLTPFWNFTEKLLFFFAFTYVVAELREAHDHERALARTDPLTGAANTRQFYEAAGIELQRAQRFRYEFTLLYTDVDNFKKVNDTMGHSEGDNLLRSIVRVMQENTRGIDLVARLGGDEFAILLPGTDYGQAERFYRRLEMCLGAAVKDRWPVSFSMGVITFQRLPPSVEAMVRIADALMYTVKSSGKNNVRHERYGESAETARGAVPGGKQWK